MIKCFVFFLIVHVPLFLLAQQPFGKNATWVVQFENEFGYRGFRQISYSHDTVINGESWQKFSESGVKEIKTGPNPNDLVQTKYSDINFPILYLTRNDSVFRMDENGKVNLSFDFNAQVGDRWLVAPWDTSLSCVDTPFVKVINTGIDNLNGKQIQYWDIVDPLDTIHPLGSTWYGCSASHCMGGRVYEKMGAVYMSLNSSNSFYNFEPTQNICGTPIQLPSYYLRCYQDDSLNLNFTGQSCDFWKWLDLEEDAVNSKFLMYPNPNSSGGLNIESPNEFDEISATNISGQVVFAVQFGSTLKKKLSFEFDDGLYFIQLKNQGNRIGIQKLLIQ